MAADFGDAEFFSDQELYEQLRFGAIATRPLAELYERDTDETRATEAASELTRRGWFSGVELSRDG